MGIKRGKIHSKGNTMAKPSADDTIFGKVRTEGFRPIILQPEWTDDFWYNLSAEEKVT